MTSAQADDLQHAAALPLDAQHGQLAPSLPVDLEAKPIIAPQTPLRLDGTPAGAIAKASAGNAIQISGSVNYTYDFLNSSGTLSVARVTNTSSTITSGSLRLELWATTTPYSGGGISGYRVSTYRLQGTSAETAAGNLPPGGYFYDIYANVAIESRPPAGSYYAYLIVSEYSSSCTSSDNFCIANYIPMSPQLVVPGSGGPNPTPGPGTPSGASISLGSPYSNNYDFGANTMRFNVASISNGSTTRTTGTLRLEFWATQTAYAGGGISGYRVAIAPLNALGNSGTLQPGYSFTNVVSTVPMSNVPPGGTYYATLILSEYNLSCGTSDGYCIVDYGSYGDPFVVPQANNGGGGSSTDDDTESSGGGAPSPWLLVPLALLVLSRRDTGK